VTDRSYAAENAAATADLRELAGSLSDADLAVDLGDGWNVSMAFAHLAFWDAWHVARWQHAAASGDIAPTYVSGDVTDRANDALVATWRAMPGASAVALALDAADIADNYVADLEDDAVDAAIERGGPNWFERFPHRGDHIDQIRRALGRG
jgi:hypothetical protein